MDNIDDLINRSETEKNLELRPELWRKLERRLDEDEPVVRTRSFWRPWMIAASVMLLVGFSTIWKSTNLYSVEDLSADKAFGFTKEELVLVNFNNYPPKDYSG